VLLRSSFNDLYERTKQRLPESAEGMVEALQGLVEAGKIKPPTSQGGSLSADTGTVEEEDAAKRRSKEGGCRGEAVEEEEEEEAEDSE